MLSIAVPGSKSITQRALIACALSDDAHILSGALRCDDSVALIRLLKLFGHSIEWRSDEVLFAPRNTEPKHVDAHCDSAGTTLRFGSCLSLVHRCSITLDGSSRLRDRPLETLISAIASLGVQATYLGKNGHAPVRLQGPAFVANSTPEVTVDSQESSQFVSGLLMVAPRLPNGLVIRTQPNMVSKLYVDMTLSMLRQFGISANEREAGVFHVSNGKYCVPAHYEIEGDWSSAAFVLAAAQIASVDARIPNLPENSIQGDSQFAKFLPAFNKHIEREFNLTHTPDLIAPLAALAAFSQGKTILKGASHTRTKECDRVAVLASALRAIGCSVYEFSDGLSVEANLQGQKMKTPPIELNPMDDHRMAMCFGLLELGGYPVIIKDRDCVSKSFPSFWKTLQLIRSKMT